MANVSFKIEFDNVDAIKKLTDEAVYTALQIVGDKAADHAAALAPVQTGNLKNSITAEVHNAEKEVWVGTDVEYAASVEFGHHQEVGRYVPALGKRLVSDFVPPKPYFRPAMENNIDEYKNILVQELKNSIS